jgi:hypothetical protein
VSGSSAFRYADCPAGTLVRRMDAAAPLRRSAMAAAVLMH